MSEATRYIEDLVAKVPEQGEIINVITDLHRRRLWHQLSVKLLEFVVLPEVQQKVDLVEFYSNFVKSFELRLNQLTLARIVVALSSQITDLKERIAFIKSLSELPKVVEHNEANIFSRSILAELHILNKDLPEAKSILEQAKATLDETSGAEAGVFSAYHRAWAGYYKVQNDPANFFSSALQYLGYTQLDHLSKEECVALAFDLSIAALLGEKIFNFGELMQHPILEKLIDSPHAWLREVLLAFNSGNIEKWEGLQKVYSHQLNEQEGLKEKNGLLHEKISILSVMELVFNKPSEDRRVKFLEIAKVTKLPLDKVELLLMRALSLGLLKGTIDEVDQIVDITWVQPRILSLQQISSMRSRLSNWSNKVNDALRLMESGITQELVS